MKKILATVVSAALVLSMVPLAFATDVLSGDGAAEQPAGQAVSEVVVTDEASGVTVEGEMPADVELSVSEVEEENYNPDATAGADEVVLALDIAPTSEGTEWQPSQGKKVTVTLDVAQYGIADGTKLSIVHDDGAACETLGEYTVENGLVSFETGGFSDFYFFVKFERDGYSFTLSGGGEAHLSEILEALKVDRSVDEVVSVEFSNPELVSVERAGADWLLTSLESFGTEENLTVTFSDGEVLEIRVTDPVIYNYAVGSDITNVPLLATKSHTVKSVDNGDKHALNQTYTVNSAQITVDNVKTAGVKEKTAGVHPAPDAIHMIIYAKEGMAIDFIGGTDWNYAGSKPTYDGDEIWFWSWESPVKANYAVIKDGSAGKQAKFTVTTKVTESGKDVTYYCNVVLCVVEKSSPRLLSEALPEINAELNSNYSLKNLPVTLYNYDGAKWNEHYNSKSGNYFAFAGTVEGVVTTENATNRGWTTSDKQANGGGGVALMGILKEKLENGLPVMSQGQQVDLFSTSSVPGKTVYDNVGFQFIYNEDTGYYSYNAALNHAQYNSSTNELELYEQSLAPSDTPYGASHGNGGFYPFADITKAFTNTGHEKITAEVWAKKLEVDKYELIPSEYSADILPTNTKDPANNMDMHYGLQVDAQFYLPEDKKVNGEDMVYNFTGDDDLWVFIDGKLVLDIGGGHTYVSGSFNLTDGSVWVEKYSQLAAADGGYYDVAKSGTDLAYTDSFLTGLEGDQMHRIQIFYLERHSGVSNCNMHFNLPIAPTNAVEVSKSLDLVSGIDESVALDDSVTASDGTHGNEDYTFTVYVAEDNNDSIDAKEFAPLKGATYTVMGAGIEGSSTRTTDAEDGSFTLKAGQRAYFEGIKRFTEVYVVESTPSPSYQYTDKGELSVNSAAAEEYAYGAASKTKVVQKDEGMTFAFTNHMVAQDLVITKKGVEFVDDDTDATVDPSDAEYQSTVFTVNGPSGEFEVVIHANGSATIRDLIPGTYVVTENEGWSWRYGADLAEKEVSLTNDDGTALFTNDRENPLWLSGDNWCRNLFKDTIEAVNAYKQKQEVER